MPYDLQITTKPENKSTKYSIQVLKEIVDILKQYENQTIEVELHKVKEKIPNDTTIHR